MLIPTALLLLLTHSPSPLHAGPEGAAAQAETQAPARGPLMPWQRNLEDALALSKASGKPLLICVNADGEVASDRLANSQYRDPEFVKLVQGFIPVLASPTRHRPRDYDDFGRRLADPKFGRLVESEHLDIEPVVYKRYFKGRRVAPRHVGVSPDGEILFDLFLLNNLGIIDSTLREHGVFDGAELGQSSGIGDLLASHAHGDRLRLEKLYAESSLPDRMVLTGLALSPARSAQHPELVRMAFASESEDLQKAAMHAVLAHPAAGQEFMLEAYRVAEGEPELQRRLADAIAQIDRTSMTNVQSLKLRRQVEVLDGLSTTSRVLDVGRWELASRLTGQAAEASNPLASEELTDSLLKIEKGLRAAPKDAELHQLHARALLALAKTWIREGGGNPTHVLTDAIGSAQKALALEADLPLARAVLANAAYLSSDLPLAKQAASEALLELHSWAGDGLASDVVALFAKLRARDVYSAFNSQGVMSAEAIADVCAAHEILLSHPQGSAEQAIEYLNFLNTIGASSREERVARKALSRFGDNGTLHGYLRHYVLRDRGAAGMETAYLDFDVAPEFALDGAWYAALSVLVAAERHALEGRLEQAMTAYRISIKQFQRVLERNPEYVDSSNHYIGMAYAGMARQMTDAGELDQALECMRAAAAASISCFGAKDGLDRIPKKTLVELKSRLRGLQRGAEAEQLTKDLAALGLKL